MDTCICEKPSFFGYTCPVHKRVCKAWPRYAELVRPDEKGDTEQFFMDESQMGAEDYEQVIQSHKERARHHSLMAKGYRLRAEKRFGKP